MSHCTRFDFTYSDEESIVKAFRKMGVLTSTELVCSYSNDLQKKVLNKLGCFGNKQMRAICGQKDGINMFVCKIEENKWELICENSHITPEITNIMNQLSHQFQQSYVEVAVDLVVNKIENSGTPTKVEKTLNKYTILFGPNYEYQIVINYNNDTIKEEVLVLKANYARPSLKILRIYYHIPKRN